MSRIVISHYRYKRLPRKRAKAAALEVPQVVTISDKTRKRVAKAGKSDTVSNSEAAGSPPAAAPALSANDDRKPDAERLPDRQSTIVTARKPRARAGNRHLLAELPDTEEEHRRRGDLADAMFQEMKRQIAEKVRKNGQ